MKLSTSMFAISVSLMGLTALAAAQDAPTPLEPATAPPTTDPLQPMTRTTPMAPQGPQVGGPPVNETESVRPDELSFGIGAGWVFPQSLETPNVTSVRIRLAGGLTFEPLLSLATSQDKTDDGNGNIVANNKNDLSFALLARIPVIKHRRVDFDIIASAGIESLKDDPMGDFNNTTTTTLSLGWGIAVDYWVSRHVQVSMTASNPLVDQVHVDKEVSMTAPDTSTTTTSYGLVFKPVVALMVHLYN